MKLRVYILGHDDPSMAIAESYAARFSWMRAIQVPKQREMESAVFPMLNTEEWRADWDRPDIEFVGILKYNFQEKMPFYDLEDLCQSEGNQWDIWTFVNSHEDNYGLPNPTMTTYAGVCHTLFPVLWFLLWYPSIPVEHMFHPDIPAFYSNAWMVRKSFFHSLVSNWMPYAFAKLNEEPLRTLALYNANYLQRLPVEDLTVIMDAPYYTYHCFLLERIPCLAFWAEGGRWRPVGGPQRRRPDTPEPGLKILA
jgi:hypothetical protein